MQGGGGSLPDPPPPLVSLPFWGFPSSLCMAGSCSGNRFFLSDQVVLTLPPFLAPPLEGYFQGWGRGVYKIWPPKVVLSRSWAQAGFEPLVRSCCVGGGLKVLMLACVQEVSFAAGEWIGVELDEPKGMHDGTVFNESYFSCQPKHGVFCQPKDLGLGGGAPAAAAPAAVSWTHNPQKRSGDPNPQYFSKSTAVQMGGVLPYKLKKKAYCSTNGRRIAGFPFL